MTSIDRTWAIRVEARGLEPVVTGPLTRNQADVLVGMYLDQDRDDTAENGGPTGRRITVEEYDPTDLDLTPLIPEGEERTSWIGTVLFAVFGVAALYFAFRTYHLQIATPRPKDAPIAAWLAFTGTAVLLMSFSTVVSAAWNQLMRRWARSTRKRPAEVPS